MTTSVCLMGLFCGGSLKKGERRERRGGLGVIVNVPCSKGFLNLCFVHVYLHWQLGSAPSFTISYFNFLHIDMHECITYLNTRTKYS